MIKLYQFARTWGIPNLSHFCAKTETYLRLAKLEYEAVPTLPLFAPRGKLPYIEDQGRKIADSRHIVRYLQSNYGDNLDVHLSAYDKSLARAFQRLLEEHLFWATMYTRWTAFSPTNWQTNKGAIFNVLPPVARDLAASLYRLRINGQMQGHGIRRSTAEEVFNLGREDLDALSDFLGSKPYFMGDRPTSLDASAFGILVNTLGCPIESPIKDHALSKSNLGNYCARMQQEYYPELPPLVFPSA